MIRFRAADAHRFFFDGNRVLSAVERTERRVLSRFGAYVMRGARGLIRSKKKPSKPGQPPRSITGVLKKFLYFVFDPSKRSVVIGPARTNQISFDGQGEPVKGTIPEALEHSGSITIQEARAPTSGKWWRRDFRFKRAGTEAEWEQRKRTVKIEARPFMGPAFAKEQPKLSAMWRDAVK